MVRHATDTHPPAAPAIYVIPDLRASKRLSPRNRGLTQSGLSPVILNFDTQHSPALIPNILARRKGAHGPRHVERQRQQQLQCTVNFSIITVFSGNEGHYETLFTRVYRVRFVNVHARNRTTFVLWKEFSLVVIDFFYQSKATRRLTNRNKARMRTRSTCTVTMTGAYRG